MKKGKPTARAAKKPRVPRCTCPNCKDIHININLDGKTIVARLIEELDKHAAATGDPSGKRSDVLDHMNPETATDGRDSTEYLRRLHAGELD